MCFIRATSYICSVRRKVDDEPRVVTSPKTVETNEDKSIGGIEGWRGRRTKKKKKQGATEHFVTGRGRLST